MNHHLPYRPRVFLAVITALVAAASTGAVVTAQMAANPAAHVSLSGDGCSATLDVALAGPSGETSGTIEWGDGSPAQSFADATLERRHTFSRSGRHEVAVSASWPGGSLSMTLPYDASCAPVVSDAAADPTGDEGDLLTTSGRFTSSGEPVTITTDSSVGTLVDHGDGTWTWSHDATDELASTRVQVRATTRDGETGTDEFLAVAGNVAPSLSPPVFSGPNCYVTMTITTADPGTADSVTGSVSWGDGNVSGFSGRRATVTHSYARWGTYGVKVDVSDGDGGSDSLSLDHDASCPPLWSGDLSSWDFRQWDALYAVADRVAVVPSPGPGQESVPAARFTVHAGDQPIPQGGNRAEVALHDPMINGAGPNLQGVDRWYGWQTYIPHDFYPSDDWQTVTQWHQPDTSGPSPLRLGLRGNYLILEARTSPYQPAQQLWRRQYKKGVWTSLAVHTRWSANAKIGLIELWRNSVQELAPKVRRTLYLRPDGRGEPISFKQGLYRSSSITWPQTVYHRQTRIGTNLPTVAPWRGR